MTAFFRRFTPLRGLSAGSFVKDLLKRDIDGFMTRLTSLIASMPYGVKSEETESWFQTVVYLLLVLLGQ